MTEEKTALIVFARKPEAGKVKTRLAATIGDLAALAIYRRLLEHTKSISEGLGLVDKFVFLTHPEEDGFWSGFLYEIQSGESLGDKMKHAFSLLFDKGYRKVLIVGTDCPTITTAIVEEAILQLNEVDVVIGPAEDGGYYLLGMNALDSALFEDIDWSTEKVLPQTISKLENDYLSFKLLEILNDVDEEKDLPRDWL